MSTSRSRAMVCIREVCLIVGIVAISGCAGGYQLAPMLPGYSAVPAVAWIGPVKSRDASVLSRWRAAVGQPLVRSDDDLTRAQPVDELTIVSWNTAVGAGDVSSLVGNLRHEHPNRPIVLLLQEVFREYQELPSGTHDLAFARRIRPGGADRAVDALARSLDLAVYYVPSMGNGAPTETRQDRGNAILSSLPLTDFTAIELPFERQRRVAVAATIGGTSSRGETWRLRIVSAHFDNRAGVRKVWVGGEYGRARQARGLVQALRGNEALVLGGDFNTWFGFADAGFRETARAFPQTAVTDRRRSFRGVMRLDHVFYRLPTGWQARVRRADSAGGSDHHPLITEVRITSGTSP